MAEPTSEFFKRLAERPQPALGGMVGSVRFDITDGERTEHWLLQIHRGDVDVAHKNADADCVISADIATFDAILTGKMNAMAAVLRGAVDVQGKVALLAALQRLFPGSSRGADEPSAGYARRRS
jgi:putative sterol carrier protein